MMVFSVTTGGALPRLRSPSAIVTRRQDRVGGGGIARLMATAHKIAKSAAAHLSSHLVSLTLTGWLTPEIPRVIAAKMIRIRRRNRGIFGARRLARNRGNIRRRNLSRGDEARS